MTLQNLFEIFFKNYHVLGKNAKSSESATYGLFKVRKG